MEVTTVSPSPISPTEEDDLCEIDVTSVVIHSVALLICLCGLAGNGALLGLHKLEGTGYGIIILAVLDFLFLLFTVPSALIFLVEDVSCSLLISLNYLHLIFFLSILLFTCAPPLLRPRGRSIVLYMLKLFQPCYQFNYSLCLQRGVAAIEYWAFFALLIVIATVTSLCPSHEQEHCRAALISSYAIILLIFVAPVLISSTMDIIKAKCGSQQQKPKGIDIIIFIILLFTVPLSICNFLHHSGYITVPTQVVFLLTCIHSSIKPFILLAGRCWWPCFVESLRNCLQRVFQEQNENTAHRNDDCEDTVL